MEFIELKSEPSPISPQELVLREIEKRYGVSLTVHDIHGKLRTSFGEPLLPGRNLHPHECCALKRYELPFWNSRCCEDCQFQTERKAASNPVPHMKICWKNLEELVVPVARKGELQFVFYAGVFRSEKDVSPEMPEWFRIRYKELPRTNHRMLSGLAAHLEAVGAGFLEIPEKQSVAAPLPDRRLLRIQEYIRKNAHGKISLATLGNELFLSPSRCGHLIRELCGKTFVDLLEEERILRSKALLRGTDRKLSDIASSIGYPNEFYFSRVFTRHCGIAPGRFRKSFFT